MQYLKYVADVINSGKASIHDTIAKNSLALFKSPRYKVKSKSAQQVTAQRSNVSLFGRLYVANQQNDGDLGLFVSHENQSTPPPPPLPLLYLILGNFVLDKNQLCLPALILVCKQNLHISLTSKIVDGSAVVDFLPTASAITFADYANTHSVPLGIDGMSTFNTKIYQYFKN